MQSRVSAMTDLRVPLTAKGLYLASRIPERHRRCVDETHEAWRKAREELWDRIGSGFLIALVGNRGSGKTQLAEQAVKGATSTELSAFYTRAMTIFLEIRATYRSETLTELAVVEKFCTPRLLVIDEIQVRGDSEWEGKVLDNIIDERYGAMRDTLIVGNLKPDTLRKSLGPSVMDRLNETGRIIECAWESFRKCQRGPTSGADHANG
jgi:DNA replication protein DnaC